MISNMMKAAHATNDLREDKHWLEKSISKRITVQESSASGSCFALKQRNRHIFVILFTYKFHTEDCNERNFSKEPQYYVHHRHCDRVGDGLCHSIPGADISWKGCCFI